MVEHKKNPIIYIGIVIVALLIIILVIMLKGKSGVVNNSNEPTLDKNGNLVLPEEPKNNDPYVYSVTSDVEHIFEGIGNFGYNVKLNKMPNTAWEPYYYLNGKELRVAELDISVAQDDNWYQFREENGYYLYRIGGNKDLSLGKHSVKFGMRNKENKKIFWEEKKDFEVENLDLKVEYFGTKKKGKFLQFKEAEDVKTKSFTTEYDLDYIEWDYTITNNMPYDINGIDIKLDVSREGMINGKYKLEEISLYDLNNIVLKKGVNKPDDNLIQIPVLNKLNDYEYMISGQNQFNDVSYFKDSYPISTIKRNILPKSYNAGNYEWIVNDKDEVLKGIIIQPGTPYTLDILIQNNQGNLYSNYTKLDLEALS